MSSVGGLGGDVAAHPVVLPEVTVPSQLSPYVNFTDQARPALEFWATVFGGTVAITTFGEFGVTDGVDPQGVMHGQLETPAGYTIMASDVPPGMPLASGSAITLSLTGDDGDALRGCFAALAEGGTVSVPLAVQMWGDEFGQLTDRFGVGWLVNIAVPKDSAPEDSAPED